MSRKHSKQQIQDMLNSGMRQIEIAKALGVGKGTIANLVCRNDLHDPHFPERRPLPGVSRTPRAVHVQRMLFAGMRQVEIAAAMGLTPATISGIVKRNKLRDSQSQSHGQHGTWRWTVPETVSAHRCAEADARRSQIRQAILPHPDATVPIPRGWAADFGAARCVAPPQAPSGDPIPTGRRHVWPPSMRRFGRWHLLQIPCERTEPSWQKAGEALMS